MQNGPMSDQERIALNRKTLHGHFDEVYLVNMPQELNKRVGALTHLRKHGIAPQLWTATSGYEQPWLSEYHAYRKRKIGELHYSEFNEIEQGRGSLFIDSPGVWGYLRTYEKILRDALERQLDRILIFEDDVLLTRDFELRFKVFLDQVGSDWKVLQLGASQYDWSGVEPTIGDLVSQDAWQGYYHPLLFQTCGSFAMGLHASIGEELLGYLEKMDSPFDQIPLGLLYRNYPQHCFVAFPNLVVADVTRSTIRQQRHQHEHAALMRWDMQQFRFPRPRPAVTIVVEEWARLGVNVGASILEQAFDVHWMRYGTESLLPVHENPGRTLDFHPGVSDSAQFRQECLSRSASFMTDPWILTLGGDRDFSDVTLTEALNALVVSGRLSLSGAQAYARTLDGYVAVPSTADAISTSTDPDLSQVVLGTRAERTVARGDTQDSTTEQPKVTVIIPTYRRAENLAAAIQSVLDQTYPNLELIVVDDNPPDSIDRLETRRLVQDYLHDPRVVYIQQPENLGGAAARNQGLFRAKGQYICFLDDDDVFLPEKIEASVLELNKLGAEYGGVYCGFLGWNSPEEDASRYLEGDLTLAILKLDYQSHYLHTCTAMYRKTALMRINGFDETFRRHQDLELNLRFFQHFKIGVVRRGLVRIRPEAPATSNFLQGEGLYSVKKKYLEKFRPIIERYSEAEQREVYRANWSEVINLFDSRRQVIEFCQSQKEDTFLRELIPLLSFDSDSVFHSTGGNQEVTITVENIQDLYHQLDQGGPLPSKTRALPPQLCDLLDVRIHHQRGDALAMAQLLREKPYLRRGLFGATLKDVFATYVEGIQKENRPISDPCLAAHIRQFVLGPTLVPSIRRGGQLQLALRGDHLDCTAIQVDPSIRETFEFEGLNFKVGKYDCIKLMKHGLLVHPNSDRNLVHVRLNSITHGTGVLTHFVLSLANEPSEEVVVFMAPNLRKLSRGSVTRIAGGTKDQYVPIPKPGHRQWSEGLYFGVRMSPGRKPDGARLMLTHLVVSRERHEAAASR